MRNRAVEGEAVTSARKKFKVGDKVKMSPLNPELLYKSVKQGAKIIKTGRVVGFSRSWLTCVRVVQDAQVAPVLWHMSFWRKVGP